MGLLMLYLQVPRNPSRWHFISPDGAYVGTANTASNDVTVYTVDTGVLNNATSYALPSGLRLPIRSYFHQMVCIALLPMPPQMMSRYLLWEQEECSVMLLLTLYPPGPQVLIR